MDGESVCNNLEIVAPLGTPGATRCRVYRERYPGYPIMLINKGRVVGLGACAHGSSVDTEVIIAKGIGKGCSLKVVP